MAKFIELPIVTAISKENNRNIAFIIDDKDVIDSFYGDDEEREMATDLIVELGLLNVDHITGVFPTATTKMCTLDIIGDKQMLVLSDYEVIKKLITVEACKCKEKK